MRIARILFAALLALSGASSAQLGYPVQGGSGAGNPFPVSNGAANAPAINFIGDTNAGFYLPGAGTIGVTFAGSSIYRFTATSFNPSGNGVPTLGQSNDGWKGIYLDFTNTGTVGAVTINKPAGRVNIAAAGTAVVVTNSLVTAASKVIAICSSNDVTALVRNAVPAAGSFTINMAQAPTAQTSIDFIVINAD